MPNDVAMMKSGDRVDAAFLFLDGCMKHFQASLLVGCPEEREQAREAVLSAHSALLDAFEGNAWLLLERRGINPQRRHL